MSETEWSPFLALQLSEPVVGLLKNKNGTEQAAFRPAILCMLANLSTFPVSLCSGVNGPAFLARCLFFLDLCADELC